MPAEIWGFLGVLVGAFVSIGATYFTHSLQFESESKQWKRNKLYELIEYLAKEVAILSGKVSSSSGFTHEQIAKTLEIVTILQLIRALVDTELETEINRHVNQLLNSMEAKDYDKYNESLGETNGLLREILKEVGNK